MSKIVASGRTFVVWTNGEKLFAHNMLKDVPQDDNAQFVAENWADQARIRAKKHGFKAAYCTEADFESVRNMHPIAAIQALWSAGWALSASRAAMKAETTNATKAEVTNKPAPAFAVTVEVATQFAKLRDRNVVGWAAKLSLGDHTKVISGLMTDGATNGKAAIVALTEAVKAMKKPCAVTIIYDSKDRQMATLEYAMAHGFTTKAGKPSACMTQMAELQPYWAQHTFSAKETTSTEDLRDVARNEIAKAVVVSPVVDPDNGDEDEIEMML